MNRILIKDFFVEIWTTRKRFLSIFLIVALGCGFFAGVHVTGTDMKNTLDYYFSETDFMDAQVMSPYGLVDGDLELIKESDGVAAVDPAYLMDFIISFGESNLVARFHSYSDDDFSHQFVLTEGRLPENPGECLIEEKGVLNTDLPDIGDSFTVSTGSESRELDDFLVRDSFTVVGTVRSPLYFSTQKGTSSIGSGSLETFVFMPESEFSMEEYPTAFIFGFDNDKTFSDDYKAEAKEVSHELEELSDVRGPMRHQELKDKVTDAQEELETERKKAEDDIADGEKKLADAEKDLAQGEVDYLEGLAEFNEEIANAQKDLADAKIEIEDGWKDYEEGKETFHKEIADAEIKLADAEIELIDGEKKYHDGRNQYLEGYREYKAGKKEYDYQRSITLPKLKAGRAELEAGKVVLDQTRAELDTGKAAIEQGKELISQGENDIKESQKEIDEGYRELQGAKKIKQLLETVLSSAAYLPDSQVDQIVSAISEYDSDLADVVYMYIDEVKTTGSSSLDVVIDGAITQIDDEIQQGEDSLAQAQLLVDQGKTQLDEQKQLLETEEQKYLAGEELYAQGLEGYKQGIAEIEYGEGQLENGRLELEEGRKELSQADYQLTKAWEQLEDGKREYEDGLIELADAKIEGRQELADARRDLLDGEAEYEDGLIELADAKRDGQKELDDALVEIEDGKVKIIDAQKEIEDGKIELRDTIAKHQKDIDDAKETVADITSIEWIVTTRDKMFSVEEFATNAERIDAIAAVFPVFFLAIAVLVSLTTMTRMVEDQRIQVGTLKSLGYSNTSIMLKFIGYASLASFFGGLFGLYICLKIFPTMIYSAFASILYITPPILLSPHWEIVVPTLIVAILATVMSTFFVSYRMLKEQPANLLRPEAPKPGKRILLERIKPIWSRLSFNWKVTFRNIFRYKRRMLMSIVGVAGCTALMLAGFALRDAIGGFINAQFEDIISYDMEVVLDDEEPLKQVIAKVEGFDGVETAVSLHSENITIPSQNNFASQEGTLLVFKDKVDIKPVINLLDMSEQAMELTDNGAVISEKLAKLYSVSVGDTLTAEVDDTTREIKIAGITKNYLFHYVYMTESYYHSIFSKETPVNRQYVVATPEVKESPTAMDSISEEMLHMDEVLAVIQTISIKDATGDLMDSLDTIVFVLIISAGLLAFIVMYNLTNINIIERRREIATLKVLGFYDKETSNYIFGENVILSFIGALFGLGLGVFLSRFIISVAEVDNMMFLKEIKPLSFVYALALTMVFTFVVRVIAHFQLKEIDMIESLQSVE